MDGVKEALQMGVLEQLDRLLEQSEMLQRAQTGIQETGERKEAMSKKLEKLLQRRNELQQELDSLSYSASKTVSSRELEESMTNLPSEVFALVVEGVDVNSKKRRLEERHLMQRVFGHAFYFLGSRNRVVVELETFHRGRYFENYYVVLSLNDDIVVSPSERRSLMDVDVDSQRAVESRERSFMYHQHSLPFFVPIKEIYKRNSSNLQAFVHTISSYVLAYVVRRQQVLEMRNIIGEMMEDQRWTVSPSYDLWDLTWAAIHEGRPGSLHIRCIFDNLCEHSPSHCRVHFNPNDDEDDEEKVRLIGYEEKLASMYLIDVFRETIRLS